MSRSWNRLIPYPILAPWTDDYGDARFSGSLHRTIYNEKRSEIALTIKYHLTSTGLQSLIDDEQAVFVGQFECPRTFKRLTTTPSRSDEDVHVLDAGDFSNEILFTPYVVATANLKKFRLPEHAPEIRQFLPCGFDITEGSMLAVGNSTNIEAEDREMPAPHSVIDLVELKTDQEFMYVDLTDNRIKIFVPRQEKERIEALRRHPIDSVGNSTLFPAVYLHAVSMGISELLANTGDSKQWTASFEKALRDTAGPDAMNDQDHLRQNALVYAQQILKNPIRNFLTAALDQSGEE